MNVRSDEIVFQLSNAWDAQANQFLDLRWYGHYNKFAIIVKYSAKWGRDWKYAEDGTVKVSGISI